MCSIKEFRVNEINRELTYFRSLKPLIESSIITVELDSWMSYEIFGSLNGCSPLRLLLRLLSLGVPNIFGIFMRAWSFPILNLETH